MAYLGHDVAGLDADIQNIQSLNKGKAPLFEPGLDDLIQVSNSNGKLKFYTSAELALEAAEVLWVAFDTPVDDEDRADSAFVLGQIQLALPFLADGAVVLVSSQMPVGSIRKLEAFAKLNLPNKNISFACAPENLRLGKALEVFLSPDRIVVGVRDDYARKVVEKLLSSIACKVEWMSVESAEMTKHAINAFLATSITFANEIAAICELVGADAKEVERGLKTETRIGPRAYVSPGGPFAGGTLARDIAFLEIESQLHQLATPLLSAVRPSNDEHKNWVRRKLLMHFGSLSGVSIAIWGLTYKPGTDTLRRSLAVELCYWLLTLGAKISVYDPAVKQLPKHLAAKLNYCSTALDAVAGAHALVVGTEWPEFKEAALGLSNKANPGLVVVDANRHLQTQLLKSGCRYVAVGSQFIDETNDKKNIVR
jgi:UDPglucose 6-dehydrogenase